MKVGGYSKAWMARFGSVVFNALNNVYTSISKKSFANIPDLQEFAHNELSGFWNEPIFRYGKDYREYLKRLVDSWKGYSMDVRIIKILVYVHNTVQYKKDSDVWIVPDYWQSFRQTFSKKSGDCEDGAIMIFVLARLCGIPANRVRVDCSWVKTASGKGGHAFVVYTGSDGLEYIIDWCYDYNRTLIGSRLPYAWSDKYFNGLSRWFGFNDLKVFGKPSKKWFAKL